MCDRRAADRLTDEDDRRADLLWQVSDIFAGEAVSDVFDVVMTLLEMTITRMETNDESRASIVRSIHAFLTDEDRPALPNVTRQ
jgi:hypothetical protein